MKFSRVYIGVLTLIFAFLIMFNIGGSSDLETGAPPVIRIPIAIAMVIWGIYFAFVKTPQETETGTGAKSMATAIVYAIGWIVITVFIVARIHRMIN